MDARLSIYSIYVGIRHKNFSFWPNCAGGALHLHYTGYNSKRSYSVTEVNGNRNRLIPLTDIIQFH